MNLANTQLQTEPFTEIKSTTFLKQRNSYEVIIQIVSVYIYKSNIEYITKYETQKV